MSGLTQLASGITPAYGREHFQTANGVLTFTSTLVDLSDSASFEVIIEYITGTASIFNGSSFVTLEWYFDRSGRKLAWRDDVTNLQDTITNIGGRNVHIQGPTRAPYLIVTFQAPNFTTNGPATVRLGVFGMHLALQGLAWQFETGNSVSGDFPTTATPIAFVGRDLVSTGAGTEQLDTLDICDNLAAITSATSFTVPSGRKLLIQSLHLSLRQPSVAGSTLVIFRLRTGNSTGGNIIYEHHGRGQNTDAVLDAMMHFVSDISFPFGLPIPETQQFCFTDAALAGFVNTRFDVSISGILLPA